MQNSAVNRGLQKHKWQKPVHLQQYVYKYSFIIIKLYALITLVGLKRTFANRKNTETVYF